MESYISHPDFGKSNFELFKTIKQETNNFQIDELLYLKKDLGNILNGYLSSHNQTRTSSEGSIITDFSREINLIENKLQIIDDELGRLEREKAKGNPKGGCDKKSGENRVLAYNNNIENALKKIELILDDINIWLFENSTSDQWKQILNLETPTNPIICKSNIDINCLTAFCEKLCSVQVFRTHYKKYLAAIKVFQGDKLITIKKGRQFTDARQYGLVNGTSIDDKLKEIFSKFNRKI